VPQGSVPSPVLFICFINDIPEVVRSFIYLNADDRKIFREVNNDEDSRYLQRDLDQLVQWEEMWQLQINVDKCKVMHFGGQKNLQACYCLKTQVLAQSMLEEDVGMWTTNDLPSTHITKARQTRLIRRTFTYMDSNLMKQLLTSLVR